MRRPVLVVLLGVAVLGGVVVAALMWGSIAIQLVRQVRQLDLQVGSDRHEPVAAPYERAVAPYEQASGKPLRPTPVMDSESGSVGLPAEGAAEGDDAYEAAVPPVDWPTLAELEELSPVSSTSRFAVYVQDGGDPLLANQAARWAPVLEEVLSRIESRLGSELPRSPLHVVFSRAYEARCPARGLATPRGEVPRIEVYLDESTTDTQVEAVLAHEIAHHVTITGDFVGDGVLTEGIANWAAADEMLAWQGVESWDDAVRAYLLDGSYVSITDPAGQSPIGGEDCLARRDRVYNARTSFVSWMVRSHGIDNVLAMPCRLVPVDGIEDDDGSDRVCVPDYREVTGFELDQLEQQWLEEVRAG